jgi:cobalamin biosynthesis protein CbiG
MREPAVVALDEAGRFAISVLGGHRAGADPLTKDVAAILGATPIVTTTGAARSVPQIRWR